MSENSNRYKGCRCRPKYSCLSLESVVPVYCIPRSVWLALLIQVQNIILRSFFKQQYYVAENIRQFTYLVSKPDGFGGRLSQQRPSIWCGISPLYELSFGLQ